MSFGTQTSMFFQVGSLSKRIVWHMFGGLSWIHFYLLKLYSLLLCAWQKKQQQWSTWQKAIWHRKPSKHLWMLQTHPVPQQHSNSKFCASQTLLSQKRMKSKSCCPWILPVKNICTAVNDQDRLFICLLHSFSKRKGKVSCSPQHTKVHC